LGLLASRLGSQSIAWRRYSSHGQAPRAQQLDVESGADLGNDVQAVMVNGLPVLWSEDEP